MSADQSLAGRVAIVTGSARNIGRATALELARQGAAVVVNTRGAVDQAASVVKEIEQMGGRAVLKVANVIDPEAVKALIAAAVDSFGRLDILVNNAAVRPERAFAEMSYAEWREVLAIVLDGAFLCAQAALPHLARSGQGAIVNFGGLTAHTGAAKRAHVITAKTGIIGLTRALAHDLAPHHITVNCVVPGMIDTRRLASSTEGSAPAHHAQRKPLVGRRGEAQEIADLVRFLCGPEARYITGQTIHANGGLFMP